jgi:hypothetical protein
LRAGLTLAALLGAPPAAATGPANPVGPGTAAADSAAAPCTGAPAERAALQSERARISGAIGDIALGRPRKKRKVSGGDVAAGVAGTAASVLLPFGVGALVGAGARAAAKGGRKKNKKPAVPEPDVPAMIERVNAIDSRLEQLAGCR